MFALVVQHQKQDVETKDGQEAIHDSVTHPPCRFMINQNDGHDSRANGILFALGVGEIFHSIAAVKLRQETGGRSEFAKLVTACMVCMKQMVLLLRRDVHWNINLCKQPTIMKNPSCDIALASISAFNT